MPPQGKSREVPKCTEYDAAALKAKEAKAEKAAAELLQQEEKEKAAKTKAATKAQKAKKGEKHAWIAPMTDYAGTATSRNYTDVSDRQGLLFGCMFVRLPFCPLDTRDASHIYLCAVKPGNRCSRRKHVDHICTHQLPPIRAIATLVPCLTYLILAIVLMCTLWSSCEARWPPATASLRAFNWGHRSRIASHAQQVCGSITA